ncbi:MAG: PPOX class F420-dependent oxidoreductase [Chloroflexi bacterium]|nr:PPOX class F420-dependent oxidoreductase [Chloroflexota bacterium]
MIAPSRSGEPRGTRKARMIAIPPSARRLLENRAYGHLVTRNPDGSPQMSMLWFDVEGDELLCNTVDGRVKVRNIRRDPRVIVSVQDHDNPLWYLLVHGRVTAMTPEGAQEHIERLGERFTEPGEQELLAQFRGADAPRLLVRIAAERLGGWGPWLAEQGETTE